MSKRRRKTELSTDVVSRVEQQKRDGMKDLITKLKTLLQYLRGVDCKYDAIRNDANLHFLLSFAKKLYLSLPSDTPATLGGNVVELTPACSSVEISVQVNEKLTPGVVGKLHYDCLKETFLTIEVLSLETELRTWQESGKKDKVFLHNRLLFRDGSNYRGFGMFALSYFSGLQDAYLNPEIG